MSRRDEYVGVIGTGQIGSRMARRLHRAGYEVIVYDREPSAMADLFEVERAPDAASVAKSCNTLITCVTDSASVEEVIFGTNGVHEALRPGHLVIETTTSTPSTTRALAESLRRHGADLIDAPMSRGVPAAEKGTLAFMVGGQTTSIERAQPILSALGTDIVVAGEVGSGHIAKALNMMVMAVNFLATSEAVGLALSLGIPGDRAIAAINESPAHSFVSGHHFPRYVLPGTWSSGFTVGLMRKDLAIALEVARDAKIEPLLGALVLSLYHWCCARGCAARDNTELARILVPSLAKEALDQSKRSARNTGSHWRMALAGTVGLGTLEALAVAQTAKLQPSILLQVLNVSSGSSACVEAWTGMEAASDALDGDSLRAAMTTATRAAATQESPWWLGGLALQVMKASPSPLWPGSGSEHPEAAMLEILSGRGLCP